MKKSISFVVCLCLILSISFTNIDNPIRVMARAKTATISVLGSYNYKLAQYILKYTNKERTKRGLPKLKMDKSLKQSFSIL